MFADAPDVLISDIRMPEEDGYSLMRSLRGAGIASDRIIVDPGLGFAKEAVHTYETLARIDEFSELGRPVLVGPSRKRFLTRPLGVDVPAPARDWATAAAVAAAVLGGAHIVRVHAVREMTQVARVSDEIRKYHRDR